MKVGVKMFPRLCVGDLQKIVDEIGEMERWTQELQQRAQELQIQENRDFENLLFEICQYYNDCIRCPLKSACRFAQEGCQEVFLCENCPRLRLCVEKGSEGLFIYLRDSKSLL
jgi:hypothetical protein